jgi:hypothetical protein
VDQHLWLEQPVARICILLIGPLPDWAWLADCLDKDVERLRVELAARWEVDAVLEAWRALAMKVQDSMLGGTDVSSSLVAIVSHFPKLD